MQFCRRRRIDKTNISTPVGVDQRSANCLEEVIRSITRPSGVGVDHCVLASPSVIHCQFFGSCRSIASTLASLWNYSTAHELLLSDRKIFFSKTNNPPPFKLRKLLEFLLISSWRRTLISLNVFH
ncbi:uncharacterized protein TNCV_3845401 [Trichonephila clavipes]|nr:uncharacterized protein TNCV_3845401 [Trichonephila clavipes]